MKTPATHGILNPQAGAGRFVLQRHPPSPDLAPFIERFWLVRWDLGGLPPHDQETLPYPCVNMVFGTHRPGVHGVCRSRFVAKLCDSGWVVGVKFRPGAFRPFLGSDVAGITDRVLEVGELFGAAGRALERAVDGAPGDDARLGLIEAFLRGRRPGLQPDSQAAGRIVDLAQADPSIARVTVLAERAGLGVRALERLFRAHVGVSPKWVIRRFRVQEAAERAGSGAAPDWGGLALELGYFDQSHFIRDFKAQVGRTPTEYAAQCGASLEDDPRGAATG
jgi:AraC-like DNA-binding protein